MKKTVSTTSKTTKATKSRRQPQSANRAKNASAVIHTPEPSPETPAWVTALAIFLIIIGYAVYRLWGVAKVDGVTISRLAYYRAMEQQVGDQTLDNLITQALIVKAGRDNNVVIDQKAIDEKIATISAQLQAQGQTVEQALAAEHITMDEVRHQFALQQIVDALGTGDTSVSAQEIDDYIAKNKSSLPTTLSVTELRNMVEQQLQSQKSRDNIAKWLSDLKTKAEIIRY